MLTRSLAVTALLASSCCAQIPAPAAQSLASQAQAGTANPESTITVPAGTRVPLTLTSQITTKSRAGDTVRAATAFPVTVDTQLAIPAGTYVEGKIEKVTKSGRSGPSVQIHFTRILYSNGYTVSLDGINAVAKAITPETSPEQPAALPIVSAPNYALSATQQTGFPPPPPPSHIGPSIGTVVGVIVGVTVAGTVALILLARHHGGSNGVLFDTGWQFDMILQAPLSVDASRVAASVGNANAQ